MIKTFLATEILEELPNIRILKDGIGYIVILTDEKRVEKNWFEHDTRDESLPNALAKMWLYLKKENLLGKE